MRARVRVALKWAAAGAVIPFGLTGLEAVLGYLNPHYLGLSPAMVLVLWPSRLALMALHGSEWDLTAVLFVSVVLLVNAFFYAITGFALAPAWTRIAQLMAGERSTLVVLVILVLLGGLALMQGVGRPVRYELPAGYQGWAVIEYDNASCAPLRSEGIFLVVAIPPSGFECTSSLLPGSVWRYERYEYVSRDGTRSRIPSYNDQARKIWATLVLFQTREEGFPQRGIFVGTEAEYRNSGKVPYRRRASP